MAGWCGLVRLLRTTRIAAQCPGLQAGGEAPPNHAGLFCCSMYWRRTSIGAPPTDAA